MIYHTGPIASLSFTSSENKPIDVADVAQKLFDSFASSSVSAKSVVLRHDVAYTHEAGAPERLLFQRYVEPI